MKNFRVNNQGFTLVELIVVIAIMGVILILALPQVSKIQRANKDKKYEAYHRAIENGTKLYIDSRAKDLFGNNSSGCVVVKYSELKQQNLVKDFGEKDITCNNDNETYVEVRKINDNYDYATSLVCKKGSEIAKEIKDKPLDSCENSPDTVGPKVIITPLEHDWVQSKNLKIKIKIQDDYTLNKNIGILYYWTNSSGAKVSKEYTYNFKNKKGVKSVLYQIPTKNIPTNSGEYKLVVKPWYSSTTSGIQDALGNQSIGSKEAGIYKIDNTKPTCASATGAKSNWTKDDFTIYQYCSDNESGCKENPYSKKFTSTTVTYTFDIADKAGNTNTCEVDVYLDKTAPTKPSGGAIGSVSGSDKNASIKTEVSGSTDKHSGFSHYLYLVTNSSQEPSNTDSRFTTSMNYIRSCGTSYYAWAVAVDKAGNRSSVVSLGNTKDEEDKFSEWSSCSKNCGVGSQSRTNTCELVTSDLVRECNNGDCCSSVRYENGTTCSKSCGGGTYNQLAYSKYNGERCPSADKSSGGGACNTVSCCSSVRYENGSTCSKSCGGGTYNQLAYSKYTGERCPSSDKSSGGSSCNTHACPSSCSMSSPKSCPVQYTCRSTAPDVFKSGHTNIRNEPSYNSSQAITIWSNTKLYVLQTSGNFSLIYVDEAFNFSTQNQYWNGVNNNRRMGWIKSSCMLPHPVDSTNFCPRKECKG